MKPPILLTRDPALGRETLEEFRAAGGYTALDTARGGLAPAELRRPVSKHTT